MHKEDKEPKVHKDQQVHKVLKELQEDKEPKVHKDQQVHKVLKELQEDKEPKDQKVYRGLKGR